MNTAETKMILDFDQQFVTGSFGYLRDGFLFVPLDIDLYVQLQNIRSAEELASLALVFPESFANVLKWTVEEVIVAANLLLNQLKVISENPSQTFGALPPKSIEVNDVE